MAEVFKMGDGDWLTTEGGLVCTSTKTLDGSIEGILMEGERSSPKITQGADRVYYESKVDEPAISYENSANGALLLEPSATNLNSLSESLNLWGKQSNASNYSVDKSIDKSPMLDYNSYFMDFTPDQVGRNYFRLKKSYQVSSLGDYTISGWIKSSSLGQEILLDLNSQAVNKVFATTEWTRFSFTKNHTSSGTKYMYIGWDSDQGASYNGGIYIYGVQVEEGSVATSYIKTEGQTEMRAADTAFSTIDISKYINSSEGVLEIRCKPFDNSQNRSISISDGTSTNKIELRINSNNQLDYSVRLNSVFGINGLVNLNIDEFNTFKIKWKSGDLAIEVNGLEENTSTTSLYPSNLDSLKFLRFDAYTNGLYYFRGEIEYIKIYDSVDDY
jgi:hypothetical protein